MRKSGWRNITTELPSPTSSRKCLIVVEKHGGDVHIEHVWWMPKNQYTEGSFEYENRTPVTSKIYLWRSLDFLLLAE
jgi:hypothetical protein